MGLDVMLGDISGSLGTALMATISCVNTVFNKWRESTA